MEGNDRLPAQGAEAGRAVTSSPNGSQLQPPGPPPTYDGSAPSGDINVWRVLQQILRRKWLILLIVAAGICVSVLLTAQAPKEYRAEATVEVLRQEAEVLEGTDVAGGGVADDTHIATQIAIIESRALAVRVVEDLTLFNDARLVNPSLPRDARVEVATNRVMRGLEAVPMSRGRIITVRVVDYDPVRAAQIANAAVENFQELSLERKFSTTSHVRQFLADRLATARLSLEQSERRLADYARTEGLLQLEGTSGSLDENAIVAVNANLTAAQDERLIAEQIYREAQRNPDSSAFIDSPELVRLRTKLSELRADYRAQLGELAPEWPSMVALQNEIDATESELERQRSSVIGALRSEYRNALARERSLAERLQNLRSGLQSERDLRIDYSILERDVDTNRSQYEALLQRWKEVSVANGIDASQIAVLDEAVAPRHPFRPSISRNVAVSSVLSLGFALGVVYLLALVDNTFKTPDDIKHRLGLPVLGTVPELDEDAASIIDELQIPTSPYTESFFSIRTALSFTTTSGIPQTIGITSTKPGEGKSSSALALAYVMAKSGSDVLIIDADMRKPTFQAGDTDSIGLSGLLSSNASLSEHITVREETGISLLPSGAVPPNPAELLSSARLREVIEEARAMFDCVIVDGPPVLDFADAPILCSVCDGTVLVTEYRGTKAGAAVKTVERLQGSRAVLLGSILNKYDRSEQKDDMEYGYYAYDDGRTNARRRAIASDPEASAGGDASALPDSPTAKT